jgi:hypothetical protein
LYVCSRKAQERFSAFWGGLRGCLEFVDRRSGFPGFQQANTLSRHFLSLFFLVCFSESRESLAVFLGLFHASNGSFWSIRIL